MKHFAPKMWIALTVTISVMGLIAIMSSIITGQTYRYIMLENQQSAIVEMIRIDFRERMEDLLENSKMLGYSIHKSNKFRQALKSRDRVKLTRLLDNRFAQYFVTAGIVQLEKLYLYDHQLTLVATSTKGVVIPPTEPAICNRLIHSAKKRKGTERLKQIAGTCIYRGRPYYSVLIPVGGLIVKGYLQIVTDPAHQLKHLESATGLPILLRYPDKSIAYQSEIWPESRSELATSLIAEYEMPALDNRVAMHIYAAKDVKKLYEQLSETRMLVIFSVILVTFFAGLIGILLLRKSTILPLQQLQQQVERISNDDKHLGEEINVQGVPEIVRLATCFNQMTAALNKLYQDISDSNTQLEYEIKKRNVAETALQEAYEDLEERINERTIDLVNMARAAQSASHAKSEFLSHMSHELRTPLNAIMGFSQIMLLDDKQLDEKQKQNVTDIYDAGKHLLSLINEILDLAHIESGRLAISFEPVKIDSIIIDAINIIKPIATEKNITINYQGGENNHCVNADSSRLKQILLNLMTNATKYNKSKGQITLHAQTDGDNMLKISVTDTGKGLTPEQIAKLFTPFTRIKGSENIEGTGIGLTITKHLVELLNGEIGVTSEPGKGSTFWFTMPLHDKHECGSNKTNSGKHFAYLEDKIGKLCVLIVEDNKTNQKLIRQVLDNIGLTSEIVEDGKLAIERWQTGHFDMILMDVDMPGMNGLEATRIIRELEPKDSHIPIIAVTALAMQGDDEKCLSAGMNDYIKKPLDLTDFCRKIELWITKISS